MLLLLLAIVKWNLRKIFRHVKSSFKDSFAEVLFLWQSVKDRSTWCRKELQFGSFHFLARSRRCVVASLACSAETKFSSRILSRSSSHDTTDSRSCSCQTSGSSTSSCSSWRNRQPVLNRLRRLSSRVVAVLSWLQIVVHHLLALTPS